MRAWNDAGRFEGAYIAVNISGRHLLHTCFLADVRHAFDESHLSPDQLVIEITETVVLTDMIAAASALESLHELGVRVALDDFGTGYTSIGHLWRLPIDLLKIDGAFVRGLEERSQHTLVELMIDVAHTLGLGLVAEGVETPSQHDALRKLACDSIKGDLIARPRPPESVTDTHSLPVMS